MYLYISRGKVGEKGGRSKEEGARRKEQGGRSKEEGLHLHDAVIGADV